MSVYLERVEDAISHIQNKENIPYHLGIVRKMLNLEFKCNCTELNLVENNTKGYFFGAHVFPTEKELYKIADNVIRIGENIKFDKCSEFIIELDSKLLYEMNSTPREIVAVLLHEIGHKAFSTRAQIRSKSLFALKITKYIPVAGLVIRTFAPIKFLLYTLILSSFESSFNFYNNVKSEMEADKFVVANGYSVELHSILTKLTTNNDKTLILSSSKASQEEESIFDWTITNALTFSMRRQAIITDLKRQLGGETSPYLRKLIQKQLVDIKKTQGSSSIKVIKNEEIDEIKNESMKTFFEIHARGFSYQELDEIEVEIQRATEYEDKLYLITRIYKDIKEADNAIESIQSSNNTTKFKKGDISSLKDYKKKLMTLLKKVKDIKIEKPDYSRTTINITYPKGYQG